MKLEEYGKENNSIIVMLHGANFVHCYLHILGVLRYLRDEKLISEAQYLRAKKYYRKLTGADITVPD